MAVSSTLNVTCVPDTYVPAQPAALPREHTTRIYASSLLGLAVLSTLAQFLWFYRSCIHNIDFDGMDYVGISRHITDGNFHASINAFRSPLISWLIAALTLRSGQLVLAGKLVTFVSFIAAEVLLYVFTLRLWRSRLPAALAVLWFSLGRGILPLALLFVSPDYLFTALTLAYFILLESCLRTPRKRTWFYLGCTHGLAYLAKSFALPWLALTTAVAVLFSRHLRTRQKLSYIGLAAIVPVIVVAGWGSVLHAKYGVFTTGSQFKTNIMQWTLHQDLSPHSKGYEVLVDTSEATDAYMVTDPMPPHSPAWAFRLTAGRLIPQIVRTEIRNLPRAIKEIAILVTPGGCLLCCFGLFAFYRWGERYRIQFIVLTIVAFSSLALVGAYCMMVFDGRYALPVVPLLIGTAAGLLVSQQSPVSRNLRLLCGTLIAAGLLFTFFYKASPFRTLSRDFQASCVDAGNKLRAQAHASVISIGEGPFPEHGIGWEAGYRAAFFGGARVIASTPRITDDNAKKLERDIHKSDADALLVWGIPRDDGYRRLITDLAAQYPNARSQPVNDPQREQVGTILLIR
jgi:4-amino-4-deoxy-L-arabinose transferase-like glycosyltransferase